MVKDEVYEMLLGDLKVGIEPEPYKKVVDAINRPELGVEVTGAEDIDEFVGVMMSLVTSPNRVAINAFVADHEGGKRYCQSVLNNGDSLERIKAAAMLYSMAQDTRLSPETRTGLWKVLSDHREKETDDVVTDMLLGLLWEGDDDAPYY